MQTTDCNIPLRHWSRSHFFGRSVTYGRPTFSCVVRDSTWCISFSATQINQKTPPEEGSSARGTQVSASHEFPDLYSKLLGDVDYVPCTMPLSSGLGKLIVLEDNDAVIKACIKGRSPAMRHVGRTHRVDLDWLWERIRTDPGVFIKFVGTKQQIRSLTYSQRGVSRVNYGHSCADLLKLGRSKS